MRQIGLIHAIHRNILIFLYFSCIEPSSGMIKLIYFIIFHEDVSIEANKNPREERVPKHGLIIISFHEFIHLYMMLMSADQTSEPVKSKFFCVKHFWCHKKCSESLWVRIPGWPIIIHVIHQSMSL